MSRRGGVSEICGPAGCGKTQLCLQLCAQTVRRVKDMHVAYICTEHGFASERFKDMLVSRRDESSKENSGDVREMTDRVHVLRAHEPSELWNALRLHLPKLMRYCTVGLVVIDSVTAPFRGEFKGGSAKDMKSRAQMLLQLAARMKCLSETHGVAFVVTNQVTAIVESGGSSSSSGAVAYHRTDGPSVKAALGLTWSNCVNARVMIRRCQATPHRTLADNNVSSSQLRVMTVSLSSHLASDVAAFFQIDTRGVVGVRRDAM